MNPTPKGGGFRAAKLVNSLVKVQKFKLIISKEQSERLVEVSSAYRDACNFVSQWVFDHGVHIEKLKHGLFEVLRICSIKKWCI